MDIIGVLTSISKLAIVAFFITFAVIAYEVFMIMKKREEIVVESKDINLPEFVNENNVVESFTQLPDTEVVEATSQSRRISKRYLMVLAGLIVLITLSSGAYLFSKGRLESIRVELSEISPLGGDSKKLIDPVEPTTIQDPEFAEPSAFPTYQYEEGDGRLEELPGTFEPQDETLQTRPENLFADDPRITRDPERPAQSGDGPTPVIIAEAQEEDAEIQQSAPTPATDYVTITPSLTTTDPTPVTSYVTVTPSYSTEDPTPTVTYVTATPAPQASDADPGPTLLAQADTEEQDEAASTTETMVVNPTTGATEIQTPSTTSYPTITSTYSQPTSTVSQDAATEDLPKSGQYQMMLLITVVSIALIFFAVIL